MTVNDDLVRLTTRQSNSLKTRRRRRSRNETIGPNRGISCRRGSPSVLWHTARAHCTSRHGGAHPLAQSRFRIWILPTTWLSSQRCCHCWFLLSRSWMKKRDHLASPSTGQRPRFRQCLICGQPGYNYRFGRCVWRVWREVLGSGCYRH